MDTTVKDKSVKLGELQVHSQKLFNKGIISEGTCSTAASTAAKTVTLGTTFELVTGATLIVKFSNAISVASATLAVTHTDLDGNTTTETAKSIYYRGAALAKNLVAAGDRLILRYNGTQYDILGNLNTDTNTKVTSVENHYAPAADSDSELSASASGATAAWGIDVVKGVQIQRDAKGHVTGVTVTSGKTPANPLPSNTVTGSGLKADKIVLGNGNSAVKTSSKGITTTNPSANSTNDDLPTSKAVWGAIADGIAANDAMVYKGTIAGGSTGAYGALTAAANRGWTYKVSTAGKINGIAVEVGDMIICNTDSTAAATSSNYSTIAAKWDYIQANVDGVLFKSSNTFTDGHVLVADGTAGKVKDSGFTIGKSVPANAEFTDNNTTYKININGTDTGGGSTSLGTIYGATSAGTSGQYLKSSGSGAPTWANMPISLPASDVSGWAKAASKPSYSWSEIGSKPGLIVDAGSSVSGTIYEIGCLQVFSGVAGTTNTEQNPRLIDAPTTSGWISGIVLGSNWNSNHFQHYLVESGDRWYTTRAYQSSKMKDWNTFAYLSDIPTTLPASDVYAWAKAATKPSYTLAEVGASMSASAISANTSSSCSITGSGNAGKSETIIYTNSGSSDLTVTIPTTYTTPDGEAIELTCPAGGYCEVNYINIGGTIYARGL